MNPDRYLYIHLLPIPIKCLLQHMIQLLHLRPGQWAVWRLTGDIIHVIRGIIVKGVLSPLSQLPNEFRIIHVSPIDAKPPNILNIVLVSPVA